MRLGHLFMICICCALSQRAQQPLTFKNREMVRPGPSESVPRLLSERRTSVSRTQWEKTHKRYANHSLMITDSGVLDDPRYAYDVSRTGNSGTPGNVWAFPSLFALYLPKSVRPAADRVLNQWLTSLSDPASPNFIGVQTVRLLKSSWARFSLPSPSPVLTEAPFRLLAIVYRPDLAKLQTGNMICDDEVRFEFGGMNAFGSPDDGMLSIFEIVMPCQTYAAYHERLLGWDALARQELSSAEYRAALARLTGFALRTASKIRLRLNVRKSRNDLPWLMKEYRWQDELGAIAAIPLERNIAVSVFGHADLFNFVNANLPAIRANDYFIPEISSLISIEGRMRKDREPVLCLSDKWPPTEELRVVLSRNNCAGCHTTETGTEFVHISNRAWGSESTLSKFLTGGDPMWVTPHTATVNRSDCAIAPFLQSSHPHYYNDLYRRHLLMDQVRAMPPNEFSIERWNAQVKPLTVGEVH